MQTDPPPLGESRHCVVRAGIVSPFPSSKHRCSLSLSIYCSLPLSQRSLILPHSPSFSPSLYPNHMFPRSMTLALSCFARSSSFPSLKQLERCENSIQCCELQPVTAVTWLDLMFWIALRRREHKGGSSAHRKVPRAGQLGCFHELVHLISRT